MIRGLATIAGLAALGLGAVFVRKKNQAVALSEALRARLPDRIARWHGPLAAAASATLPSDYPGGLDGWAAFGASVLEEESMGGDAPGYEPRGEWNGLGDRGNAETPWQLDRRYHAAYLGRADRTPTSDSTYAMRMLASRWARFDDVDDLELRRKATAAAYNASEKRVEEALAAGDSPDLVTTPRRGQYVYASEIVERANRWAGA